MKPFGMMLLLFFSVPLIAQDCLRLTEVRPSYDALRQGSSFDVEITFEAANGCLIPPLRPGDPNSPRFVLQAAPGRGLTMEVRGMGFDKQEIKGGQIVGFHQMRIFLQTTAASDTELGEQVVPATFSYTALGRDSVRGEYQLKLSLPIKVVSAGTSVKKLNGPPPAKGITPVDILLVPVRLLRCLGDIVQKGNCGS